MKSRQLLDKLLENWPVKLICFVVAIALYIFNQTAKIEKKSFVIPLKIVQEGEFVTVGDQNTTVNVIVRASAEEISTVHPNQIEAYVNTNSITKSGTYNLPVKIKVSDELLTYDPFEINVKPESIKLNLEKKDMRYIELKPSIIGKPAHGYKIADILIEPSYIQVEGPEKILAAQEFIYTDKIVIDDIKKNYSASVKPVKINKLINIVDKGPYSVNVVIEPEEMEKLFNAVEIKVNSLNEKFQLAKPLPAISVKLGGTVPNLEAYEAGANNVQIDLSGIETPGIYDIPIKYVFPSSYKIIDKSLETVSVEIIEKPVEIETESENSSVSANVEKLIS